MDYPHLSKKTPPKTGPYGYALTFMLTFLGVPGMSEIHAQSKVVKNYVGSVNCTVSDVIEVTHPQEIKEAIRNASLEGKNITVRSISASRSYSPVICPPEDGVILNVERLNKILAFDFEAKSVTVEPGVLLGSLQEELNRYGYTFPVTPDYNGVTVAGAMGTGAHNSSLKIQSAVGDWVVEAKLIDGLGQERILAGSELDALRVNLGLLGVLTEVKLRIVPQFKLQYHSSKYEDSSLEVEGIERVRDYEYAKIHWFPFQKTYVLDGLSRVDMETPGLSYSSTWEIPAIAGILKQFPQPIATLNQSRIFQCSVETLRLNAWFPPYTPVDSSFINPVGLSHQMIGGGCRNGSCAWDRGIKTRTVEAAFALEDFPQWVQDVKELIKQRPACFPILGIYLRFSAPSQAYLGQAYGRETVMFEIHIPQTDQKVLEASSDVYDEILQMTIKKYAGRPHWGKNSLPYFQGLGSVNYPKWENFKSLRRELDPKGLFVNPFWKSIESQLESTPQENCGVTRQCLCQSNDDCGKNARCEAGIVFSEARICVKSSFVERLLPSIDQFQIGVR
jgi:L-gulonolactone oxidase